MNHAVDAIERRMGEAGKHLQVLGEAVDRLTRDPKPYTPSVKLDTRRCRVVLRAVDVKPIPPELGILIGACVYQLRAGLDNLVYALAERHTVPLPDRIARDTAFPICKSGPRFREVSQPKLAGIDRRAVAVIERLQPYHRRKKPASLALLQLEELRNVDQHRLLHPVALARDVSRHRVDVAPAGALKPTGKHRVVNRTLKENAVLASFDMFPQPGAPPLQDIQVYVEDNAAIDVAFEKRSPARSVQAKRVVATLSEITAYIRWEVLPELYPFLAES